nr:hypothetical protein P5668_16750 [Bacillus subtilis]
MAAFPIREYQLKFADGTVVSLFGVVFVIAYLSPILVPSFSFLSTAPFAFVHNRYNEMEWEYHKNYAPARRRITYARNILLNRRSAKEIRLFGLRVLFSNNISINI